MADSSLLLLLREGQTAQEAVLTWQFFSSPPFSGLLLGLRGTAPRDGLGLDGEAAGEGLVRHGSWRRSRSCTAQQLMMVQSLA